MRHRVTLAATLLLGLLAMDLGGRARPARAEDYLDDRLGTRVAPILLLARRDVQAELKLDSDLASEANHQAESLHRQALALQGKAGPAIVEARKAVDQEQAQWLTTHLNSAQLERLGQIDLQWEGAKAMNRPLMVETLGLSEKQQSTLSQILKQGDDLRKSGRRWTPREHAAVLQKASALLSDRQRIVWNRLLGSPCRFLITDQTAHRPPVQSRTTR